MNLYLRARHVWIAALGMLALTIASSHLATWLFTRPYLGEASARIPVVAFAPLLASLLMSMTLADADPDLERISPRLHGRWRIVHACAVTFGPAALLAIAALQQPHFWGAFALARNTVGFVGACLLAMRVVPVLLSWAPMLTYLVVVYVAAPRVPTFGSTWWAWPMQPGGPDASWIMAAALAVSGISSHARASTAGSMSVRGRVSQDGRSGQRP